MTNILTVPYEASLPSFGSPAARKHVRQRDFVLQGNNGAWVTIPSDQYELDKKNGIVRQRSEDAAGNEVDWESYVSYRWSGTIVTSGSRATVTNEALTFADADYADIEAGPDDQVQESLASDSVEQDDNLSDELQSDNYVAGVSGYFIDRVTGNAEFNDITGRGTFVATAGSIGGWTITATALYKDTGVDTTSAGMSPSDYPFYAGATYANRASAPFRVTPAGAMTTTSGAIGGFDIGSDYVRDAADSFGMASTVTAGDDIRLWVGETFANRASAPLQLYESGLIFAKDVILAKGSLGGASGATGYGYAVGDPLLLCHFDGPRPFESDYRGSAITHKGIPETRNGGVIFRPGIFNKGVQLAEATTNKVLNPSAEATGNFSARGTATVTRDTATYYIGATSYKVVLAAANDGIDLTLSALANAIHYVTFWATGSALATLQASLDGTNWNALTQFATQVISSTTWTLCGVQISAAQANGSTTLRIRNTANAGTFYLDAIQVEQKAYATPYADGSLGDGHSWSGTAHASTSSRTAASLTYAASGNILLTQGTLSFWYFETGVNVGFPSLFSVRIDANNYFLVNRQGWSSAVRPYLNTKSGGVGVNVPADANVSAGWHHIAVTWTNGALKFYIDGVAQTTTGNYVAPVGTPTNIEIGTFNGAGQCDTVLDDLVILPSVLTANEIKSIYYSAAPVMLGINNQEMRLSGAGLGEVFGNANGLFGRNASGAPSFGLLNGTVNATTWGGASETLDSGDLLLGDNNASKANMLYDASTGTMNLRSGTTTNLWLNTAGVLSFNSINGDGTNVGYAQWLNNSSTRIGQLIGEYGTGTSAGAAAGVELLGYSDTSGRNGFVQLTAVGDTTSNRPAARLTSDGVCALDLRSGSNTAVSTQALVVSTKTSVTNSAQNGFYLDAYSSETAAAGFGSALALRAQDNGGTVRDMANVGAIWDVATSGSRRSRLYASAFNGATANNVLSVPYFACVGSMYRKDTSGGTEVSNTTTETSIYSATIEGNELGTNGVLRITLGGDVEQNSGSPINLTFRVKFGGTTVCTLRVAVQSFSGTGGFFLEAMLCNAASVSSQRAFGKIVLGKTSSFSDSMADFATSSINSASDQTVSVTVQWASAHSTAKVFSKSIFVELFPS